VQNDECQSMSTHHTYEYRDKHRHHEVGVELALRQLGVAMAFWRE
jgi:hypothetical protein